MLLLLLLPPCLALQALDWWTMLRLLTEEAEEPRPVIQAVYSKSSPGWDDGYIEPTAVELDVATIAIDSGSLRTRERVVEQMWAATNTASPENLPFTTSPGSSPTKYTIVTSEITGTPSISTSLSTGTLKTR